MCWFRRAEPDLENAFPLGESHLVPPYGLGGYVSDAEIEQMERFPAKSDDDYYEPQATYPLMPKD